eukprot:scaffold6663_cov253-Ochromonas_danica.AAC.2
MDFQQSPCLKRSSRRWCSSERSTKEDRRGTRAARDRRESIRWSKSSSARYSSSASFPIPPSKQQVRSKSRRRSRITRPFHIQHRHHHVD